MAEEPKKKKRNPQDSTLRNVRAADKRLDALQTAVDHLTRQDARHDEELQALRTRVETLEKVAHIAPRT